MTSLFNDEATPAAAGTALPLSQPKEGKAPADPDPMPGQKSTWRQWCSRCGADGDDKTGAAWLAYCSGMTAAQYSKQRDAGAAATATPPAPKIDGSKVLPPGQFTLWFSWAQRAGIGDGAQVRDRMIEWEAERDANGPAWQAYLALVSPEAYRKHGAAAMPAPAPAPAPEPIIPQGIAEPAPVVEELQQRAADGQQAAIGELAEIPIGHVHSSTFNPRTIGLNIEDGELQDLAASIKEVGLLEPILVRPFSPGRWVIEPTRSGVLRFVVFDKTRIKDGATLPGALVGSFDTREEAEANLPLFEIVAGERRWRASKLAGMPTIAAIIRKLDTSASKLAALVENLLRVDLSALDVARGYKQLADLGWTQKQIAEKVGCQQPKVAKYLGLLDLPSDVQGRIARNELSAAHGFRLAPFAAFPDVCSVIATFAVEKSLPSSKLDGALVPWNAALILRDAGTAKILGSAAKFDWQQICVNCPYKAYARTEYTEGLCFRPEHFQELQQRAQTQEAARIEEATAAARKAVTALPMAKSLITPEEYADLLATGKVIPADESERVAEALCEAASAPEAADPANTSASVLPAIPAETVPLLSDLIPAGTHESNAYIRLDKKERPTGCSSCCACRAAARDNDGTIVPICTNPKRFGDLVTSSRRDAKDAKILSLQKRAAAAILAIDDHQKTPGGLRRMAAAAFYSTIRNTRLDSTGQLEILARYGVRIDPRYLDNGRIRREYDRQILDALAEGPKTTFQFLSLFAEIALRDEAAADWADYFPAIDYLQPVEAGADVGADSSAAVSADALTVAHANSSAVAHATEAPAAEMEEAANV